MSINTDELRALSVAEKLRLIGWLWDDLNDSTEVIPLPDWIDREATRRRDEMRNPECRLTHEEVWKRINQRNG